MSYYDQVKEAVDAIRSRVPEIPSIGVVLGSGLGDFASSLGGAVSIPYDQLPYWPASRVIGHDGKLVVGTSRGRTIAALAGRCHAYEGHDLRTVTFAIRALGLLGVKTLILTNAAGGVNTSFAQGALMVIDDHFNLMGDKPSVLGPGHPIAVAWMKGRSRSYTVAGPFRAGQSALAVVFNDHCDAIVATVVVAHDRPAIIEPSVIEFLNSKTILG